MNTAARDTTLRSAAPAGAFGAARSPGEATPFQVPEVIAKELTRYLEDQIIFGELQPGARVVEEDIVRQYQVSRSPVREALRALEQEGLVTRESRRGVWVSPLSLADLDEVYACRLPLEGLAAELAAQRRTGAMMEAMDRALAELGQAHAGADVRAYFTRNLVLSRHIHGASGSATLRRLLGSIGKQALRYRFFVYSRAPEMTTASLEGNRDIVEAIRRQRPRHARTLTEDLIQRSWDMIRTRLADRQGADPDQT